MLVLTRKVGEALAIGDDVKIIVMQVKGKQVRLGVQAKPHIAVHREEVYHKIQEENQRAVHCDIESISSFQKNLKNTEDKLKYQNFNEVKTFSFRRKSQET